MMIKQQQLGAWPLCSPALNASPLALSRIPGPAAESLSLLEPAGAAEWYSGTLLSPHQDALNPWLVSSLTRRFRVALKHPMPSAMGASGPASLEESTAHPPPEQSVTSSVRGALDSGMRADSSRPDQ